MAYLVAVGFLLGLRHATDPDHLVAMSTVVSQSERFGKAWWLGAWWGMGHALAIFAAGTAIILLRLSVSPRWEASIECCVGAMLVILGIINLRGVSIGGGMAQQHSHPHDHGEKHRHHLFPQFWGAHSHAHPHACEMEKTGEMADGRLRSFGVGIVHGLAGSSAIALLVLATIHNPITAIIYLGIFGLGTLAGMLALSTLMEMTMFWFRSRWGVERWLVSSAGLASFLFGIYILYRHGIEIW